MVEGYYVKKWRKRSGRLKRQQYHFRNNNYGQFAILTNFETQYTMRQRWFLGTEF